MSFVAVVVYDDEPDVDRLEASMLLLSGDAGVDDTRREGGGSILLQSQVSLVMPS